VSAHPAPIPSVFAAVVRSSASSESARLTKAVLQDSEKLLENGGLPGRELPPKLPNSSPSTVVVLGQGTGDVGVMMPFVRYA
jgi:hypothetical protein